VFNAGSTETAEEYSIQAAHRPALGYPHAGQIVLRIPSAPAIVAIGVPLAVARACTRRQGRSSKRRPSVSASPVRPSTASYYCSPPSGSPGGGPTQLLDAPVKTPVQRVGCASSANGTGAHMRLSRSQVASLLAAGAALGMLCAPAAIADPGNTACAPGQIVIDGQCNTPPASTKAPAPDGSAPGAGTGDQSGHHY
jgi:hypothetical protein